MGHLVAGGFFDPFNDQTRATFAYNEITGDVSWNRNSMNLPGEPAQALADLVQTIYAREGMPSVSRRSLSVCY